MTERFISASCEGEYCFCGVPATNKIGEEIPYDHPNRQRHNLTRYVCAFHFDSLMDRSLTKLQSSQPRQYTAAEIERAAVAFGKAYFGHWEGYTPSDVRPVAKAMRAALLALDGER